MDNTEKAASFREKLAGFSAKLRRMFLNCPKEFVGVYAGEKALYMTRSNGEKVTELPPNFAYGEGGGGNEWHGIVERICFARQKQGIAADCPTVFALLPATVSFLKTAEGNLPPPGEIKGAAKWQTAQETSGEDFAVAVGLTGEPPKIYTCPQRLIRELAAACDEAELPLWGVAASAEEETAPRQRALWAAKLPFAAKSDDLFFFLQPLFHRLRWKNLCLAAAVFFFLTATVLFLAGGKAADDSRRLFYERQKEYEVLRIYEAPMREIGDLERDNRRRYDIISNEKSENLSWHALMTQLGSEIEEGAKITELTFKNNRLTLECEARDAETAQKFAATFETRRELFVKAPVMTGLKDDGRRVRFTLQLYF